MRRFLSCFFFLVFLCAALSGLAESDTPSGLQSEAYKQYVLRRAKMAKELGPYETWTLEQKADLDQVWVEFEFDKPDWVLHSVPTASDVSLESALAIAKKAIADKFSIPGDSLSSFSVAYTFFTLMDPDYAAKNPDSGFPLWVISFQPAPSEEATSKQAATSYWVEIASPSGNVALCVADAILLYPPPPKEEEPPAPPADELSMEEALRLARTAVEDRLAEPGYGEQPFGRNPITPEVWAQFEESAWYDPDAPQGHCWQLFFGSRDGVVRDYFGGITVLIDAKSGAVLDLYDDSGTNG